MAKNIALLTPVFMAKRFVDRYCEQMARIAEPFDEVLLLDDASTDGCGAQLKSRGCSVLTAEANLGPGGARNVLAHRSTAEWIHFHDVDDEISPDYVAQVSPYLSNDIDMLIHDVDFIDERTRAPVISFKAQTELEIDPIRSLLVHPMGGTSSTIRRELFLKVGGYDENHRCFEDGDLHLRLALSGARVRRLPRTLTTSLRHDQGASADMGYCHRCRLAFLQRYAELLPPRLMDELSGEALKTAYALLQHGDRVSAKQAIDFCRKIGGAFPRTANPILKAVAGWLPDVTVIEIQEGFRRWASRLSSGKRHGETA